MSSYWWTKLALDFCQAIAWPVVAVIVVVTFRRAVHNLADRITGGEISTDGLRFHAGRKPEPLQPDLVDMSEPSPPSSDS